MKDDPIVERFADALWMERGLSRNTLSAYQSDLNHLSCWLEEQRGRKLLNARREDLFAYLVVRSSEGKKPRSTARMLSCVRQFYQHAVREGWLKADPSAQIEAPKLGRPLPKSLTEEEVEALLEAPDAGDPEGFRDRTMLEVLYATGLRVSELVGLQLEQVSLNQGVVRVIGKGNKERLVPLGDEAVSWMVDFLASGRQELLKGRLCSDFFPPAAGPA